MKSLSRPKLFEATDYKTYLKQWIAYTSVHQTGVKARLARALKAPPSFVSQVLHSAVHFTPDHALRAAEFWKLSPEERDFFLDLVHGARAGSKELRAYYERRLGEVREKNRELGHRLKEPTLKEGEAQWLFYTHWRLSPVSLLLTLPEYANSPEKIASRLGVPVEDIHSDFRTLESLGVIEKSGNRWKTTKTQLHLDRFSPVSPVNHMLWRQKAIVHLMNPRKQNYHYSGLHTISRNDVDRIREILVDALENCRKVITPSPEEELICVSCDLFTV